MTTQVLADRIQEVTATTGTGAIALGGAVPGYRTFASVYAAADTVTYAIAGGSEWEVGVGTLSGSPVATLTRTTVQSSSNGGSAVSFSAGTKNVWVNVNAADLNAWPVRRGGTGQDFSASSGLMKFAAGVASVFALATGGDTFLTTPSSANLAALVTDETGTGALVFADSPALTTTATITRNALGATALTGLQVQNVTASDGTTTLQRSPYISLLGTAFNSVSGLSETQEFRLTTVPFSVAGTTTSTLFFQRLINGGSSVSSASLTGAGAFTTATSITSGTSLTCNTNLAVGSTIVTTNGGVTANKPGIATTNAFGFLGTNATLSTVGTTVQQSPDYQWTCGAWNSVGAVDERHDWRAYVLPATVAGTTTSNWVLQRQIAGGGYTSILTIGSGGALTAASSVTAGFLQASSGTVTAATTITAGTGITATTGNVQATTGSFLAPAGTFQATKAAIGGGTTLAFLAQNTTLSTSGVTVQSSPDYEWDCGAWNSVGAVDERHNWIAWVLPVTVAGTTTSTWRLQKQVAGGGFADVISATSNGVVTAGSFTANASGGSLSTTAGTITANRQGIAAVSTQGITVNNSTVALVGAQNQWSPYYEAGGRVWDGAASQQARWKHEVQTTAGASYRGDYVFSYTDGGGTTERLRMRGDDGAIEFRNSTTVTSRVKPSPARAAPAVSTTAVIATIPITTGSARRIRGTILGVKSDGTASYSYSFYFTAISSAGTAALDASAVTADTGSPTTTTAPTITASTSNILVTSGATSGATIRWTVAYEEELELMAA